MAAPGLSPDEERVLEIFTEKVSEYRQYEGQPSISRNECLKFVMARKFDYSRAVELYRAHQETRMKEGLADIDPNSPELKRELSIGKFTVLPGRDHSGACLALFTARLHIPEETTHQIVLKALVYMLDAALESYETQRHGMVFIYDMSGSKYANFDYELSIKILNMLKGAYPARLKKVLIVTAPMWFKAPFKILRLFVREKLRDRVYTVSQAQLVEHIPRDSLPQRFGGSNLINHKTWLQVCSLVSTNQIEALNTYFTSCQRSSQSNSRSASDSDYVIVNDMDSEGSKETIPEKQSNEEGEKGEIIEENGQEKEVNVEKEGKHKRKHESDPKLATLASEEELCRPWAMETNDSEAPPPAPNPCKKRPLDHGSNVYEDSLHRNEAGGMSIQDFVKHVKSMKRKGMYEEYARIKHEPPMGTFTATRAKYNLPKNRYSDVLCLDHSRVMLPQKEDDPSADYINANFVDGYMQKNAYISTQGPLPRTFGDFWRMVWQCQVLTIVMTTKAMERGRVKCGQYWPLDEEGELQIEEFVIINTAIEQNREYSITGLLVHNTQTQESRQVTHLQFTSWPDYGIPPSSGFLDFLFRVRACQADAVKLMEPEWQGHPLGPPIVVHCSAGIGRTGTFITTDINLHRLDDIGTVDLSQTVRHIRSQRAFSIQMPDQYVFCHLAVIDYAVKQGLISAESAMLNESESESE